MKMEMEGNDQAPIVPLIFGRYVAIGGHRHHIKVPGNDIVIYG